jgi:hypothetical protein
MRLLLKKLLRPLLFLSFLLTCFSAKAQVAVTMSIPRDSTAYPGDTVRLPLILDTNLDGENIIAFRLEFQTNSELMPLGVSTANTLTASWEVLFSKVSGTEFVITGASAAPISGTGNFIYFDFVVQNTTSMVNAVVQKKNVSTNYFNEGGYDITINYGLVAVYPIPKLNVSVSSGPLSKGAKTPVYVSGGTAPYTYTVSDPAVASIVDGNYLQGEGPGTVTVEVEDVNGVKGTSASVEVRGFEISFQGPQDSRAGQEIIVDVTTNDIAGLGVLSGSFDLSFSTSADLLEIITTGTLLDGKELEYQSTGDHAYRFSFAGSTALGAGTILFRLKLKIKSSENAGSVGFSARNILFNENLAGNYLDKSFYYNGLPKPAISGSGNNLAPGESIQFNPSGGTPPYAFSVSDPAIASISSTGLLTGLKGGSVRAIVTDSLGQFSESYTITVYDGTLAVADHTAPYGTQYDLPVYISDLPAGRGFSAFSLTLQLTTTQVQFVDIIQAGTVSSDFTMTKNTTDPGNIRIAAASQNDHQAGGVLFYIRVLLNGSLASNQLTYFYLSDVLFNEGQPSLRLTNGTIRIGDVPPTASNAMATIPEDSVYHFTAAPFNYAQPDNNPFTRISITQLPSQGGLYFNNTKITYLATIEVSTFDVFDYKPLPDASGVGYDVFKFKVNDGINYSYSDYTFTFDVTPVNDPPVFTLSETQIIRDQDFQDIIGVTLQHQVPADESAETVSYTLSPDTVDFATIDFDSIAGSVSISAKASAYGSQIFTVTANDGQASNNVYQQTFSLTVNSVNSGPQISPQVFSIAENTVNGTIVDTVAASDANGDSLVFAIQSGNTNNAFLLDASTGKLTVGNSTVLDYETAAVFYLTISVSDGTATSQALITVTVTDVNEAGAPVISDQVFYVQENSAANTLVGIVGASDPENDALTFSIAAGNTNNAFALDPVTAELRVSNAAALDYESMPFYLLTVSVSDGTFTSSDTVTVNLLNIDENNSVPLISDQSFTIPEMSALNSTVGTVVATDPDNDALLFTITNGDTGNAFYINSATGEIFVNDPSALDYETNPAYSLSVSVWDSLASASATITINISNVDEANAPVIGAQTFSLSENPAINTLVGMVVATDPNNDAISFAIVSGNTSQAFSLDTLSGELFVNNPAAIDFETNPVFTLTVSASDATASAFAAITVNISDVNEVTAPVIEDQSFSVAELSAPGTVIGTVVASDPDNDPLSFQMVSGNTSDAFAIDALSGQLSVNNPAAIDFENQSFYTLVVSASDASVTSYATITIGITDVNEANAPEIADQVFSIAEGSPLGTEVGIVIASDPNNDLLLFTIVSGNTSNAFGLHPGSGRLTISNASAIDFETNPVFTLTVSVSNDSLVSYATVTVNLTDVFENSAPVLSSPVPDAGLQEDGGGVIVSDVQSFFSDADNDPLTYQVSSSQPAVAVQIVNNEVTATLAADYNGQATITLSATDGQASVEDTFTLTVSPVNDAPVFTLNKTLVKVNQEFTTTETVTVTPGAVPADEAGQAVSYTLSPASVTFANVTISSTTGLVTIQAVAGGSGEQAFTVTASDGQTVNAQATGNFTLHVSPITSAEDPAQRNIEIYPNPAADWIYLNTPFKEYVLHVTDANGRVVMTKKVQAGRGEAVDVSGLSGGFYLIRITSGKNTYYRKLQIH